MQSLQIVHKKIILLERAVISLSSKNSDSLHWKQKCYYTADIQHYTFSGCTEPPISCTCLSLHLILARTACRGLEDYLNHYLNFFPSLRWKEKKILCRSFLFNFTLRNKSNHRFYILHSSLNQYQIPLKCINLFFQACDKPARIAVGYSGAIHRKNINSNYYSDLFLEIVCYIGLCIIGKAEWFLLKFLTCAIVL